MGDLVIVQPAPRGPGVLGTFAGTAAGVAAGTVIGDKITGNHERSNSEATAPPAGTVPQDPCQHEEYQFLGCAQTQADLKICESFRQAWLECKQKYNLN